MNTGATQPLPYLSGYPESMLAPVRQLLARQRLGGWLQSKYGSAHGMRTDRALYDYVNDLKAQYLRNAPPIGKVVYDNKLQVVAHALGTHTRISRVQGSRLKAKHEIRVAAVFRDTPIAFLRMIAVHELAHLKESEHNKAFYQLCCHMEPSYHQLEFELRLYLTHLQQATDATPLWSPTSIASTTSTEG